MEMCRWFFQGFTEIQNGRHRSTSIFWCAQKLKKIVYISKSHYPPIVQVILLILFDKKCIIYTYA